jgi:hypothetical protein
MTWNLDRLQGALAVALLLGVASLPAMAEEQPSVWPKDIYSNENAATETPDSEAEAPPAQTVDLTNPEIDWSQLDPASAAATGDTKVPSDRKARRAVQDGAASSWSSRDTANGAALSVKQPLSPFWDTRVGADMNVVRQQQTLTASDLLAEKLGSGGQTQSSGAAWAAVTAPGFSSIWDRTAIEARVDPSQDTSKLGTSLSKSVPIGSQTSITLQNAYNVIQQGIAPVPGMVGHSARNHEVDQSAKLNIDDTGTSLIAGQTLSSSDDKWLRKFGAEQKLFGGVSVSGSIGETPQGTPNKSISAGFKKSW